MSWENLTLYRSKQHLLLVGLSFLKNSSLDDLFISLYIFFASNIFVLTLKCKKEKAPTSWRSLPTITYKYIECILLYSILYLFFKYIYHFVDFLWILNIVLSLRIINCSFMLHFVITSIMFFYRIPDENHYSFILSQWLGSVKSDCYQKRLIINFSWKCHRNELCNINFLIVLDWFNIFFQPMLCHLWRQLLNNSDAPHLASTAQRPSISLILSERYLFMHRLFITL